MLATVFEESAVERVQGMGKFTWESWSRPLAAFDPAFGSGDDPAFYFGEMGDIGGGRWGLEIKDKVPIRIRTIKDLPAEFQIAEQIIAECKKRNVKPADFALDATGIGRGIAAILMEKWSPEILRVEFGGSPSEAPVSQDDARPCKEVYDRRVTELWFGAREMLLAGQLRGIPQDAVNQFCRRTYDQSTRKIKIEKKEDYKARHGRSPDDADCVVVMCELARQRGMVVVNQSEARPEGRWLKEALRVNEVYEEELAEAQSQSWLDWFSGEQS
jgi:hypothetical protein